MTDAPPVWVPSESAFRTSSGSSFALLGSSCPACGSAAFPRQEWCAQCLNGPGLDPYDVAMTGTLYSFTEVHAAPARFDPPYVLAYIDLDDGLRVLARGAPSAGDLRADQKVRLVRGRIGTTPGGDPMNSYVFEEMSGVA